MLAKDIMILTCKITWKVVSPLSFHLLKPSVILLTIMEALQGPEFLSFSIGEWLFDISVFIGNLKILFFLTGFLNFP